ncbi:hypothetical protein O4H61_03255 [Roseovarius aestuarii]|nr:hypothetical protein [Roseovarius aestuarii]
MIRAYIAGGVLSAFLGLFVALWWQLGRVASLQDEAALLTRNAVVLSGQIEQARLAADVAAARVSLAQQLSAEAQAAIAAIRNMDLGDCADETIPADLADVLGGRDVPTGD